MSVPRLTRALRAVPRGWDLLAAIVAVVVVFAASSGVAFRNTQALHESSRALMQTYDLVGSLDETLLLLSESESAERAYIITGEEAFLRPYTDATARLGTTIDALSRMAESEPLLGQHWPRWRAWIDARQTQLNRAIALRRAQDIEGARQIVLGSATSGEMAAFKAEILDVERTRLAARAFSEQQVREAYRIALAGVAIATLLGLSLIAALARYAWRYRQVRSEVYRDRELLGATLLSIGEGVIATDDSGRVRMVNRCASELTGYPEVEAQGRPLAQVFRVVHAQSGAARADLASDAIRAGEAATLQDGALLRARDGRERPVEATATPVKTSDGSIVGAVVVFRDTSRQHEAALALRESEHRAQLRAGELEAVMQSVPAAILIANDLECRNVTGNAAAYRLLRAPLGSSLGQSAHQRSYFTPDAGEHAATPLEPEQLPLEQAIAERREISNVELCLRFRSGDMHIVMGNAAPLRDSYGNVRGAVLALMDVSERKHIEAQLKEAHRRKDEFLATLAHELRNPLAPVRSGVAILRKERDGAVTSKTLGMMERQLAHMVRLIDDLLDVSRITGGKIMLRREPVPLRGVLEQAVESARPMLDAAGHLLDMELTPEPLWVNADVNRLCQVVSNLLTNAAKYTPEGGHVRLTLDRDGARARIRVIDNGLGIPPAVLNEVFNMFTQINRTLHRAQGGLGVGLSLVRQLVEKHDGQVDAHSEGLGHGSTFTVYLPLVAPVHQAGPALQEPAHHPGTVLRVLVVDDNQDAADSLALLLGSSGHVARVAYSAREALALARQFSPQIAFLDIGMPEMSGHDLARALRADPAFAGLRLVALTGWGEESDRARSKEAGFDLHVTKPIDTATLEHVLVDMADGQGRAP